MSAFVLSNATLFSAVTETALHDASNWIDGDTIRYAGASADLPREARSEEHHDLEGRFVMPGMVEAHAHLSFGDTSPFALGATDVESATITAVRNARVMLGAGFTTAISFGSTFQIDVALREAIRAGRIVGPRLLAAGQDLGATASNVDARGGLSRIADGPWALRQAVREQRKAGVDIVKIFIDGEAINPTNPPGELSFTDEEVHAIVDEAHRRRLRVACHARSAAAVKQAVRAGVDFVGHANYVDDEAVDLLAGVSDRIFVGPAIAWEINYVAKCESLGIRRETVIAQGYQREIDATVVAVRKLRAAGVRLLVGGDYGISIAPHGTYAKDLQYFVELFGMSPAQALICATRSGGEAADPSGRTGTIAPGSHADLLIVDGDPLRDITVLQEPSRLSVMKAGQLYRGLANEETYHIAPAALATNTTKGQL